jgi:hypothetical protein
MFRHNLLITFRNFKRNKSSLIFAWITVGIQATKTATANSVEALRYE